MPKLNDRQLVILSAAGSRDSGALLPLPKSFKGGKDAAEKVIKDLITRKLVEERPAANGQPAWREAKDGQRLAAFILPAGLRALGIEENKEAPAPKAPKQKPAKTEGKPSKNDCVLLLLKRKEGATIAEIQTQTGWQPHTVRAVISGFRKQGIEVTRNKNSAGLGVYKTGAA
jgi:hypothetical protein